MTRNRLALATLSASLVLAACGGAPATPDALIVGEWEQSAPVSVGEGQMAMTMSSSEMEYDADGTMEGEVMITIPAMAETADEYRMTAEGRYRVEGTTLIEMVENVKVEALDDGDEAVMARIYDRLGANVKYACAVGKSHWDGDAAPKPAAGAPMKMFFAPDYARERMAVWGGQGFAERLGARWVPFLHDAADWLDVAAPQGMDGLLSTYKDLLNGTADPRRAALFTLNGDA